MVLLLGRVALELGAVVVGAELDGVGAELRERLGRVAVLARVACELVGGQLAGGPAKVEGVLEHVVLVLGSVRFAPRRLRSRSASSLLKVHHDRELILPRPMRPPRQDIAAPPFPPGLAWVGGREPRLDRLVTVGPLLVHFFDFAQLNSVRALPYVARLARALPRARPRRPRCALPPLPADPPGGGGRGALPGLGIDWPVAVDSDLSTFRGYGCRGWPSLFLWGRGGALRWYHLGEGEYATTEEVIREQLGDPPASGWPAAAGAAAPERRAGRRGDRAVARAVPRRQGGRAVDGGARRRRARALLRSRWRVRGGRWRGNARGQPRRRAPHSRWPSRGRACMSLRTRSSTATTDSRSRRRRASRSTRCSSRQGPPHSRKASRRNAIPIGKVGF